MNRCRGHRRELIQCTIFIRNDAAGEVVQQVKNRKLQMEKKGSKDFPVEVMECGCDISWGLKSGDTVALLMSNA